METIKLTRQQLFDLVWTKPMYELCQQFGLSDNGLRKNCKKLNIPIPYIGYWSKLKYGKNPEKPPLPKTLDSSNAVVELKKLNEEELARHKFILEEDKPERTPYDVVKDEIDNSTLDNATMQDIIDTQAQLEEQDSIDSQQYDQSQQSYTPSTPSDDSGSQSSSSSNDNNDGFDVYVDEDGNTMDTVIDEDGNQVDPTNN